ncbi:hypothetical protein CLV46_1453 [Diaminobutyricimonas aerilata]|uniref:Uncharacterized protein n=1 Tax=Diaminobutyricimonas aerilata TaxID=1162967 RepID=A0A2M9CJ11_9MICO|nr:hypothetical protein [Diaminobutyricimonas aerilata]PJJ71897.1 hypothetical protein CLV46_1453 [Diaminobutyricimonas aerilata]
MQWWTDFLDWLGSEDGWRVLSTAVFPFLAILIAGVLAALIARAAIRGQIRHHDREYKASAVATLIAGGRKAATWNNLSTGEQEHYEHLLSEAEVRVRLLPLSGSTLAADWAAHQIAEMKRNSANFSFQADQTLEEFRDRLIEWQHRPGRARKLFKQDLERWKFDKPESTDPLLDRQREWAASQVDSAPAERESSTPTVVTSTPTTQATPLPTSALAPAAPTATTTALPAATATTTAARPVDTGSTSASDDPSSTGPVDATEPERVTGAIDRAEGIRSGVRPEHDAPPPVTASAVRQRIAPTPDDER